MESEVSAGGAAQLVVPQRARGCAAVLCSLAVRSCKAPPAPSLAAGRRPFINSPFINSGMTAEAASDVPMRCGRSSARRAVRKQGHARPCPHSTRHGPRDVRSQPAIATRVLS